MAKSFESNLRKLLRRTKIARQPQRFHVEDRVALEQTVQAIPPFVYQLCERAEVSERHYRRLERFRAANPSFEFVVIDAHRRDELMAEEWADSEIYSIFSRARFGQLKNDIFKYCFLFKHGGYIFDLSHGLSTSLAEFHPSNAEALVSTLDDISSMVPEPHQLHNLHFPLNMIATSGFGFAARHPLLEACISRIIETEPFFSRAGSESPRRAVGIFSGSGMLTREFRLFVGENGSDKIVSLAPDFCGTGFLDRDHSLVPRPAFPARLGESILTGGASR